jgi:hypothetical protein
MTIEFSKKQNNKETVYTLESTTSAAVASVPMPMGGTRTRGGLLAQEADKTPVVPTSKPRNFVAKNATTGGAGAHVDKKRAQKQGKEKHKKPFAESNEGQQLSVQQLATISDQALDNAYHYGRSTPGNTFGWQANLKSAEFAKRMIDAGETDIEKISDAIHQGWNVTARAFVQNPEQFDDTEKLRATGKLDAKLQQREKLMNVGYGQLPDDEQEKDRVVARALLQAIQGDQDVAEGSNSSPFNQEQNLRNKSDKELADLIQFWNRALEKNPEHKIAREQLGLIKMIRSERIGKKLSEKTASKDVTEMDNRTPSGDRREQRAYSPEAIAQRKKEIQSQLQKLKKVNPELLKKLGLPDLPEPKESVSEDHEIQMASSELQSIAKNAVNLLDLVRRYSERDGLQAWQQSKITRAADYLNAVLQSISGEQHDTGMAENFKDGRNPGRRGLAKRSGVNTGASVSSLRDTARHSSGEKQRMAHWLANMKSGRAKDEGVEEVRVAQLPTRGADYSEYSTDHLKTMLRPGILHRNEARFKALIRKELQKREQQSQQGVAEAWSQKYKSSINCSHPKGFSQKAHCAGKKKHNEDLMMEMTCPDCGMCETHGNNMMEIKQRLDAKCWKGKHKEGTKIKGGIRVNNCVPNESSDAYVQRLQAHLESTLMEKIPANAPVDVWVQDFQQADPQKYHQFRNKTPEKKAQMAVAASYAAKNPSKKK